MQMDGQTVMKLIDALNSFLQTHLKESIELSNFM